MQVKEAGSAPAGDGAGSEKVKQVRTPRLAHFRAMPFLPRDSPPDSASLINPCFLAQLVAAAVDGLKRNEVRLRLP